MIRREYSVPANLDPSVFVGDKVKARCLSIISHMSTAIARTNAALGYVSLHSENLKALAGDNYKFHLTMLERMGIIQANHHYCNNEYATKGVYSKSYRFTQAYSGSFKVIAEVGLISRRRMRDRTDKTDPICVEMAKNCCRLTVDLRELSTEPYEIREEAGDLIMRLTAGSGCARRGKRVKRIYHRINRVSKRLRKLLRLDGRQAVEYDMKSAHPVLALSLYPDPCCEEAIQYKQLLSRDIYTVYGVSREKAKKLLRKFFYCKRHYIRKDGSSSNPVANYFRIHFPILFEAILSTPNLSARLQDLESYFFNDFIVPKMRNLGLFYVSIHDGFMCASDEAAKTIRYLIAGEFRNRFKYVPEILAKDGASSVIAQSFPTCF